jgi:hypothetical protein
MNSLELTYQSFITRISGVNRKDIHFNLLRRSLFSMTAFALLALLLISLEAIFDFSGTVRKVMFFGYISAFASTVVMILVYAYSGYRSVSKPAKITKYAKQIGGYYPEIKDNLLNAIQMYDYTKRSDLMFSRSLAIESINQVNEKSKLFDFTKIISFKKNTNPAIFFVSALFLFSVLMLAFPNTFQAAAGRIINYNFTFVENTLGIAYEVSPGNAEITKGESLDILAKIMFNDPNYKTDEIIFNTRQVTSDGIEISSNDEKISATGTNEFRASLKDINANTIYWFEYKGIKSQTYNITITNRPVIKSTKITVYPPHTRLPSRTIEGNEISTIAGSTIYIELEASNDISKVSFSSGQAQHPRYGANGNSQGSFTATSNGHSWAGMKEFNGKNLNVNSTDYIVSVYRDDIRRSVV